MASGFVFITLAVIAGSTWAFIELGTSWISDPKIGISFFTWGIYLAMVFLRVTAGWRGRKAAIMAITALGCSAITWAAHARLRPPLRNEAADHRRQPQNGARSRCGNAWLFPKQRFPRRCALKSREGVSEALILSTCNRVEVVVTSRRRRRSAEPWSMRSSPRPRHARPSARAAPLPSRRPRGRSITCSAWPPAWIRWWSASRRFWAS